MGMTANLTIALVDKVSGPAQQAANSLRQIESSAGKLNSLRSFEGYEKRLREMGHSRRTIDQVRRDWEALEKALSGKKADLQLGAMKLWHERTFADLRNLRREATTTTGALERLTRIGAAVGGAYAARRTAEYVAKQGATNTRETERDYLAGLTTEESARIKARAALLSSRYPSMDAATAHERLRDTAMSMRSVGKAFDLADTIGAGHVVLQSLKGPTAALEEGRKFFKALDTLGKNVDAGEVKQLMNGYIKALGVEGADLNMGDLFQVAKMSKSAGSALSNRFLMAIAPGLMQDMGAARLGTALGSSLSQIIGGRATEKSKEEQQRLGMRDKSGNFIDSKMIMEDPFEYTMKRLIPMLQKDKVNVDDTTEVAGALAKVFSNQMVADLFTKMITQREQYEGKREQYDKAPGLSAADRLAAKEPFVALEGFMAQLRNFAAALAGPLIDPAIAGLNALTGAIQALTKAASDNPKIALGLDALGLAGGAAGVYGGWKGVQKLLGRGGTSAASKALLSGEGVASAGWLARALPFLGGAATAATVASLKGDAGRSDLMKKLPGDYTLRSGGGFAKSPGSWESNRITKQPHDQRLPGVDPFNFKNMAPAGDAGAAGDAAGEAFRENLNSAMESAKADLRRHVQEMLNMLNFNASPTITPKINAPAGAGPGKQSAKETSIRLGRLVDDTMRGNFLDHEFA